MATRDNRYRAAWICAGLALATLAVYWPVTQSQFITLDDPDYVTQNHHVLQGLTWESVVWAFRTTHAANWHPLTWLSHMLDVQLFGLHAGSHHLASLLFHIANTLLLFLLFHGMTGALWRSAFLAALFALHPLHVESVAWVAERKDVLSTFFGLLSLLAYVRWVENSKVQNAMSKVQSPSTLRRPPSAVLLPRTGAATDDGKSKVKEAPTAQHASRITHHVSRLYLLSLLLFAFSLMSKPMLVTLPFLLLLLDYWPLRRLEIASANARAQGSRFKVQGSTVPPLLLEKLPFFALATASSITTLLAQKHGGTVVTLEHLPLGGRLANVVVSYVHYMHKSVWPKGLAVIDPLPAQWPTSHVFGAALFLAAVTLCLLWVRRYSYLSVGWFWFLGLLVPVIGLVQVGEQSSADRYTYLPLVGLFLALTWVAAEFATRWPVRRTVLVGGATGLLVLCALLTRQQVRLWQNSITLFEHTLAVTGDNAEAENNLATALALQRRFDEAFAHYEAALKLRPLSPSAQCNFGIVLAQQGRRLDEARRHLLIALELQPANVPAHYHLASLAAAEGKWGDAIARYQQTLQLRPDFPEAHNELGFVFLQEGRLDEAAAEFAAALRRRPDFAIAHYNLGEALLKQQRTKDAIEQFHDALRLRPDWPELLNNLAWLLATHTSSEVRNGVEAVSLAQRACELTSRTNLWLLSTLAAAYAEAGRYPEAVSTQQHVCNLAAAQGQTAQTESFQQRLALYRAGQAYHRP
jgi:protein O-mannosyl-transferase